MSTKIHHGYKLPAKSTGELFAWMRRLQTDFEASVPTRITARTSAEACELIDRIPASGLFKIPPAYAKRESEWESPLAGYLAFHSVCEELKEQDRHCLRSDFILEITLLEAKGQLLCLLHNNSRFVESWFRRHSGAKAFPYWDNTDPPDGIGEREWEKRGKIWGRALRTGVPKNDGLCLTTQDPVTLAWGCRDKPPTPPSKEKRAGTQVENALWHLHTAGLSKEELTGSFIMETAGKIRNNKSRMALVELLIPRLKTVHQWKDLDEVVPSRIIQCPT